MSGKSSGDKMPVLFVGHGNPMNAIETNAFSQAWSAIGGSLPRPEAILCISAHWETEDTLITAMNRPRTIHDFHGFPRQLFEMQYPAPGSADLADLITTIIGKTEVHKDLDWGLDHGAWSVLCRMFPAADIPVVQLSIDRTQDPAFHYRLGRELRSLRNKGVLILGSGNIVHNLGVMTWDKTAYDWATEFDAKIRERIMSGDHEAIIHYENLGRNAQLAIPTNEHYLPLLYVLAAQDNRDEISFFTERVTLGSISMRSVRLE